MTRRLTALFSLALFLLGNNFCLFAVRGASAGAPGSACARSAAPAHACCARAAMNSHRDAEATREATAPCCVAVSPTVAAHGASVDPAPALVVPALFAPAILSAVAPAMEILPTLEDARPPAPPAATPAAGRAAPRL